MGGDLATTIEHTLLRSDARAADVAQVCDEARKHGFAGVCIAPVHVRRCADRLEGTPVRVVTVVGFPLGANASTTKAVEATTAMHAGAHELDMVLRVDALKDGDFRTVEEDVATVVGAAPRCPVKVILETALLTDEQKVRACEIARSAGAAFVKTSTGFGPGGATTHDVRLLRATVGDRMGVKASGGIRDTAAARALVEAGADRIGTSAGVAIVSEAGPEQSKPVDGGP
ncbi:MAG: deoxyribose-phosphate aldolase [Myxococcota bacterium]